MSEQRGGLPIMAFLSREALEQWLEAQSGQPRLKGIWLKLAKKDSRIAGIQQNPS